ncbi:hypothetical protein KIPB_002632 [Kipferlia bialata]|uniref:Uncharacterized protein n=1 Tax=Kipferlia bialata TaxID=797122 RepID=A0A9K3GF39_9EUKA|nr:hypothetical protein KIPB_002632 [Kipferlia bialata]|eukprot:g2632.t1
MKTPFFADWFGQLGDVGEIFHSGVGFRSMESDTERVIEYDTKDGTFGLMDVIDYIVPEFVEQPDGTQEMVWVEDISYLFYDKIDTFTKVDTMNYYGWQFQDKVSAAPIPGCSLSVVDPVYTENARRRGREGPRNRLSLAATLARYREVDRERQSAPLYATFPRPSGVMVDFSRPPLGFEEMKGVVAGMRDIVAESMTSPSALRSSLRASRTSRMCASPTTSVLGDLHTSGLGDSLEDMHMETDALHHSARKGDGGHIPAVTTAEGPASRVARLTLSRDELLVQLERSDEHVAHLQQRVREAERERESVLQLRSRAMEAAKDAFAQRERIEERLQAVRKRHQSLLAVHKSQIALFEKTLALKKGERDRERRRASELETRLAEAEEQVETLQLDSIEQRREIASCDDQVADLQLERERLMKEMASRDGKVVQLQQNLTLVKQEREREREEREREREVAAEALEEKESLLKRVQAQLAESEAQKARLLEDNKTLGRAALEAWEESNRATQQLEAYIAEDEAQREREAVRERQIAMRAQPSVPLEP